MKIIVTSGMGEGSTPLAAFDAALYQAGIANYNLIKLTSIIPPNSLVRIKNYRRNGKEGYGKKLYIVLADKRQTELGREAWAGIGWVQSKTRDGLFVEQVGTSQMEVMRLIKSTVEDMIKYRHKLFGPIHYHVVGRTCREEPVSAVVAAVYQEEDWA